MPIIFTTREQLHDALYQLKTLDQQQRELVANALQSQFDDGGISEEEFILVVRQLRKTYKISEIDERQLLALGQQRLFH
jgi:hypothetical protein